jgi:hypothetical protein
MVSAHVFFNFVHLPCAMEDDNTDPVIILWSAAIKSEWPLYPRYPLDRLGGPQSRSGHGEMKILDPNGARTATPW